MEDSRVILDTDFIEGITSYRSGDAADLFCRVFQALDKKPVIHEFIASNELMHNPIAQSLISEGTIGCITAQEVLQSWPATLPEAELLYQFSFEDLYQIIQHKELDQGIDIFASHAGMSFGEIHSILLAVTLKIPLFYSNDGGSKDAASYYARGSLTVQNAEEIAGVLRDKENISSIERRFIGGVYKRARTYKELL